MLGDSGILSESGTRRIKWLARAKRLIKEYIERLHLDLSGTVVLTEAASGNHVFAPLIAAMANAEKVIAATRDSKYGKAADIAEDTLSIARKFGIRQDRIDILGNLRPDVIEEADIITNLGFVRPISREFISHLKKSASISLMYETWEFREQDLDLGECVGRGIPVLGVNEEHHALKVFNYIGHLCMKILFETELEIFRSKIVVVGDNRFGKYIVKTLVAAGADILCATNLDARFIEKMGATKIGDCMREERAQQEIKNCDAFIINTYPDKNTIIGEDGDISPRRLSELSPDTMIMQFNGRVDRKSFKAYDFTCLPREEPNLGHMGWTLAYLGPKPVIALTCGGLKVGELLARGRLKGESCEAAKRKALRNSICQDFSADQYEQYLK